MTSAALAPQRIWKKEPKKGAHLSIDVLKSWRARTSADQDPALVSSMKELIKAYGPKPETSTDPKGEVNEIKEIMKKSRELGMQTFDQHLFELYEGGHISYEDALRNADSVNELRLMIKLQGKEANEKDLSTGIEHLNIV